MPDTPNTAEPGKPRRRWFQFRLRTLLIGVALLSVLLGVLRWLVILVGSRFVIAGLAGIAIAAIFSRFSSIGYHLVRRWERRRSRCEEARQLEATRRLLESEEVKQAIIEAKGNRATLADP